MFNGKKILGVYDFDAFEAVYLASLAFSVISSETCDCEVRNLCDALKKRLERNLGFEDGVDIDDFAVVMLEKSEDK